MAKVEEAGGKDLEDMDSCSNEGRLNKSDPRLSQDQVPPSDLPVQHG